MRFNLEGVLLVRAQEQDELRQGRLESIRSECTDRQLPDPGPSLLWRRMSWRKVADCQAKYFIRIKFLEGVQRRSHRRVLGERQQADPLQDGEKHQVRSFFPHRMRHETALARIRLVRLGLVPQGSLIRHAFLELLRKGDKDNDCPVLQVVQ